MMMHRVDERSQQMKFYILQPYKKMGLMPTFYSTLSKIFFIFYRVTLLGGFHPGSRGAYAVPTCLCRDRRWSSYRLSRTDFPPRIPETEQIAERPDRFQKMFLLKGHKWHLLRILFTGVAMGGYSSIAGDLMFFAPKTTHHTFRQRCCFVAGINWIRVASFLCKSKNE